MKNIPYQYLAALVSIFFYCAVSGRAENPSAKFPIVFAQTDLDFISSAIEREAAFMAAVQRLPSDRAAWETHKKALRERIVEKTGLAVNHTLPVDYQEMNSRHEDGFTVKGILFQSRPGIYVTATLYIPDGQGKFPAVVVMMGHSRNGRIAEPYQKLGSTLALNGYVALNVDPWGAGERATTHGEFEYHGANLGASLWNIGESLMGAQIADNMRAVDLLCSLPYVDPHRIGATGSSGGGNQTMWLSAMDERIAACVPVVSVGTFRGYVMRSNCVCETLVDGLTYAEESAVLGLVAPRALKICNGLYDEIPAFAPAEMLCTFGELRRIYDLYDARDRLSNHIAGVRHGYQPEFRESMIGWFDLHLRGRGAGTPKKETAGLPVIPEDELMIFARGQRDTRVVGTARYCRARGDELRTAMMEQKKIDIQAKKLALRQLLKLSDNPSIVRLHRLPSESGWERIVIETSFGTVIPLLHRPPADGNRNYTVICGMGGKNGLPESLSANVDSAKTGIVLADLWATGENGSAVGRETSVSLPTYHTLSRACLWTGKRMTGLWVDEFLVLSQFLTTRCGADRITLCAEREMGVSALFASVFDARISALELHDSPVSYRFDRPEGIDFYTMAVHLPGVLTWGDLSLAAGLSGKPITLIDPRTMSGRGLTAAEQNEFRHEYRLMGRLCGADADRIRFRSASGTPLQHHE